MYVVLGEYCRTATVDYTIFALEFQFFLVNAALCALYIISGLDEVESISPGFYCSKLCFTAFLIMNAVISFIRILRIAVVGTGASNVVEILYLIFEGGILCLEGIALIYLCKGFGSVLKDINSLKLGKKALLYSGHILAALVLQLTVAAYDIIIKIYGGSVQPIVENAVKHGALTRKDGRGRVLLSTEEIGGFIRITILDNGYGYKELTEKENRSKGIGIENTKERLETLCRGSLSISSDGAGTKAVIFIPEMEA